MIRPALTSLLALAVALPAAAADIAAPAKRCDPKLADLAQAPDAADIAMPAGLNDPGADLHAKPEGALCEDAVWRVAAASWADQASGQKKARLLAGAAGVLETLDADVAALEAAAGKIYDASVKANLLKEKKPGKATVKGRSFATVELKKNDNPTQAGADDMDQLAAKLHAQYDALAQLAVAPPPAAPVKGKPAPPAPATMGPAVLAYYTALEKVRFDAMKAQALGVPLKNLTPLFAPGTNRLADNYKATAQAIAAADAWDDAAAHDSLLDALQDRGLRDRAALHTANVEMIYQAAKSIAAGARDRLPHIDELKKAELDKLNNDLRAKVLTGIDYETAKKVFDGEVERNDGYASTLEGQMRAEQLAQAKASADRAQIVANAKGGYKLQYADAQGRVKTIEGKDNIPDLKTARTMLEQLSGSVADDILKGHDLMAKTHAALEAARAGATSFGENGLPVPRGESNCSRWGAKCEDLAAYKKRLRDLQMEEAAHDSASRQPVLEKYLKRRQEIKEEYERELRGGMDENIARGKRDTKETIARREYESSTAGSMNSDIAARTARLAVIDQAAESSFVERIEVAGSEQIPARMRPNLKKYVSASTAKLLNGDDGRGPLFDQFVADEWTPGKAALETNAEACKDSYREGDYGALEKCAGESLKTWLGKNVARTSPAVAARMRARLKDFVGEEPAQVLLEENGSDDGKTTMFDQFLGGQWTAGQGDFGKNAAACKGGGEYEAVEKCTEQSLKDWLAKRKRAKPVASTDPRTDVTTGDKR